MNISSDKTGALRAQEHGHQPIVYGISAYESNSMKSDNPHSGIYEADTTRTLDNNGGNPACNQGGMIVLEGNGSRPSHKGDGYAESEVSYTLNAVEQHGVCQPIMIEMTSTKNTITEDGISPTLTARMGTGGNQVNSVFARQRSDQLEESEVVSTQSARQYKGWREDNVSNTLVNGTNPDYQNGICSSIVRRLTPLECERLQGYPDGWTDIGEWVDSKGKTHKDADSPRYKALGNSIALPFWEWMAKRMAQYLPEGATMASLFDGIGGFPLVFSRAGVTPVWASEIEEFPIAVTKRRFPDD